MENSIRYGIEQGTGPLRIEVRTSTTMGGCSSWIEATGNYVLTLQGGGKVTSGETYRGVVQELMKNPL